jgi:hypothetical protein
MRRLLLASLLLIGCSEPTPGPQGPAGPTGPQGAQGEKGAMGDPGLMGSTGGMGAMGNNGVSVVAMSLPIGDTQCPTGGSKFTAGAVTTYACNGALGPKGDKGDQGDPGPNVVNASTQFTASTIPASAINRNSLNADLIDGRHAQGGTNDSSADLIAYIEKRVCEAKGGFWSDSSGCLPFMRETFTSVASASRYTQCSTEFGPEYAPCNVYQALALSQSFPIPQRQYYWLSPGGTVGQNGTGIIARIANIPSPLCAAGQTVAFFHSWDNDHVDSPECRDNTETRRVLCCRRNFF